MIYISSQKQGSQSKTFGVNQLYFDDHTETADAAYEPFQTRMNEHLCKAGYTYGLD